MDSQKKLKNGWAWEAHSGLTCHFSHVKMTWAKSRLAATDDLYVVETINWSFAEDTVFAPEEKQKCHFNKYFCATFEDAIAFAAKSIIEWKQVAEDVVGIRKATHEELHDWDRVNSYYVSLMPIAISEKDVEDLPDSEAYEDDTSVKSSGES